ncbi:MAG: hypothetical protein ABJL67_22860 [Sulfitobacter sp.]
MQQQIENALVAALARYQERVEEPFRCDVALSISQDADFFASVAPSSEGISININTGVLDRVKSSWNNMLGNQAKLLPEHNIDLLGDPEHVVDMALRWLLQHELNHFAVGHFLLTDGAAICEGQHGAVHCVVERSTKNPRPQFAGFSTEELALVPLALELQADHDATEIVLGAYSPDNWALFQYYATCIIMVMLLIERHERIHPNTGQSHPHAAARLFMLMGHLCELPHIPSIKRAHREGLAIVPPSYQPTLDELDGYNAAVIQPVYHASRALADAAGVSGFWESVGPEDDFFEDVFRVIAHGYTNDLKTPGARQCAKLKPVSDKLLDIIEGLGGRP